MRTARTWAGSLIAIALVAGSFVPAEARPRDRWHHRDRDNFGVGDAIGIAALIGAVAIVATSMKKNKDEVRDRNGGYTGPDETRDTRDDRPSDNADFSLASEDAAIDACAVAARDEAAGAKGYAEVRSIAGAKSVSDGWDVDGTVETRASYRDSTGDVRRFTCSIRQGRVDQVYLSRDIAVR